MSHMKWKHGVGWWRKCQAAVFKRLPAARSAECGVRNRRGLKSTDEETAMKSGDATRATFADAERPHLAAPLDAGRLWCASPCDVVERVIDGQGYGEPRSEADDAAMPAPCVVGIVGRLLSQMLVRKISSEAGCGIMMPRSASFGSDAL
ncbi:uncharacterized protein PSANT_06443 [Moesziomyces antarcticus]|uniref:Uncharacterized protein n=1 Tax=Pseudozyma antarctica TaxID=84753 RepID=A0A5C3FWP9_PSEA2|nr:uncharacterized protein PSANT_06443 [Moesziomyces antarcticus]